MNANRFILCFRIKLMNRILNMLNIVGQLNTNILLKSWITRKTRKASKPSSVGVFYVFSQIKLLWS